MRMVLAKLRTRSVTLAIDEAHDLGPRCLDTVKTLINQTPTRVVLFAWPTLWRRLERGAFEETRQLLGNRLAERIKIGALREADVRRLLERRAGVADDKAATAKLLDGVPVFSRGPALELTTPTGLKPPGGARPIIEFERVTVSYGRDAAATQALAESTFRIDHADRSLGDRHVQTGKIVHDAPPPFCCHGRPLRFPRRHRTHLARSCPDYLGITFSLPPGTNLPLTFPSKDQVEELARGRLWTCRSTQERGDKVPMDARSAAPVASNLVFRSPKISAESRPFSCAPVACKTLNSPTP